MTTFSEQHKNNPATSGEIKGVPDRIKELEGLLINCKAKYMAIKYGVGTNALNNIIREDCEEMIKKITQTLAKEDSI